MLLSIKVSKFTNNPFIPNFTDSKVSTVSNILASASSFGSLRFVINEFVTGNQRP